MFKIETTMAYNYVVTAAKPSSVSHAITATLFDADTPSLVVAKSTRLEIYNFGEEGLEPVHDVPIYGKVSCIKVISCYYIYLRYSREKS